MSEPKFRCDKKKCFANQDGWCRILTKKIEKPKCPFFKTSERLEKELEKMEGNEEQED